MDSWPSALSWRVDVLLAKSVRRSLARNPFLGGPERQAQEKGRSPVVVVGPYPAPLGYFALPWRPSRWSLRPPWLHLGGWLPSTFFAGCHEKPEPGRTRLQSLCVTGTRRAGKLRRCTPGGLPPVPLSHSFHFIVASYRQEYSVPLESVVQWVAPCYAPVAPQGSLA